MPEGKLSQEKLDSTLELIQKNLIRLENFVSMMSSMQKLDDMEPKPELITTDELFSCLKENTKMICWDKKICFSSEKDSPALLADKMLIEQIVANLVSNASRYAENSIYIKCSYLKGKLVITVRDDGVGFSAEALKHAFDPYYTQEDKRESDHFGIGLNVCKLICEKIGGSITCENKDGALITFSL